MSQSHPCGDQLLQHDAVANLQEAVPANPKQDLAWCHAVPVAVFFIVSLSLGSRSQAGVA